MKKLLFFIAIASISVSSFASSLVTITDNNEPINRITIKLNSDSPKLEMIKFNFGSAEELMNFDLELLRKFELADAPDRCSYSVTITVNTETVSTGLLTNQMSGSLTIEEVPCEELVARINKYIKVLQRVLK
jgi:hypothetical protein